MASRKEEKEARRAERLEAERAAKATETRNQRLFIGAGVLLAVAVIAVIVVIVAGGGGGGGSDSDGGATQQANTSVKIPAQKTTNFNAAIKASGCVFKTFPSEGRTHLSSDTAVNNSYKTNPPTSGNHRPTPAEDGIYAAGNEPDKENWVHTLEHGRIEYQYAPGTPAKQVDQLQSLFAEPIRGASGYHQMVFENNTKMPFAVAAVAWTHYVGCKKFTDQTFDAFRVFRDRFVDKGPEFIP